MMKLKSEAVLLGMFLILFTAGPAAAVDFKFNAYKTFSKGGQYTLKNVASESVSTDDPSVSHFMIDLEAVLLKHYAFSIGWQSSYDTYQMTINSVEYVPTDEKQMYIFGFKAYLNEQHALTTHFNFYFGVQYLLFYNSFTLSSSQAGNQASDAELYDISKSLSGTGTAFNLGAEIQFKSSGLRLEAVQREMLTSENLDTGSIEYSLDNTDLNVGVFLFF